MGGHRENRWRAAQAWKAAALRAPRRLRCDLYMVRTGGSWELLPHDLPPWRVARSGAGGARRKKPGRRDIGQPGRAHDSARRSARLRCGKDDTGAQNVICWWTPMA